METVISSRVMAGDCVVVYSAATGRVRRWLASDTDGEIAKVALSAGEAFIQVGKKKGLDLPQLQDAVDAITGKTPANDRYVVIKAGAIVNAIIADPSCGDAIQGSELIAHETADGRWAFDSLTRTFTPPILTVEEIDIQKRAAARAKS